MAIKTFKPTTPSRRHMTVSAFEGIDKKAKPERSLVESQKKHAGRNSYGRITVRHHGGGNKQKYRIIDFKRDKMDVPATVLRLEYDPNRSAFIALVQYEDGEKRYIIAPVGLKAGDKIISSASADIKPGNCLPIANIPVGTVIHNIEMHPGKGAQLVRSAGTAAQLMAKENGDAQIRMPSGEVRIVRTNCTAYIQFPLGIQRQLYNGMLHVCLYISPAVRYSSQHTRWPAAGYTKSNSIILSFESISHHTGSNGQTPQRRCHNRRSLMNLLNLCNNIGGIYCACHNRCILCNCSF